MFIHSSRKISEITQLRFWTQTSSWCFHSICFPLTFHVGILPSEIPMSSPLITSASLRPLLKLKICFHPSETAVGWQPERLIAFYRQHVWNKGKASLSFMFHVIFVLVENVAASNRKRRTLIRCIYSKMKGNSFGTSMIIFQQKDDRSCTQGGTGWKASSFWAFQRNRWGEWKMQSRK